MKEQLTGAVFMIYTAFTIFSIMNDGENKIAAAFALAYIPIMSFFYFKHLSCLLFFKSYPVGGR